MGNVQLANLVNVEDPLKVWKEVQYLTTLIRPGANIAPVQQVFNHVIALFAGRVPGYLACNLEYHNLKHTTDTFLAMARLMHGAVVEGHAFSERNAVLGLVVAMLHDTGYIQTADDVEGTGAKYTATHVTRSIEYMQKYFSAKGFSTEDTETAEAILGCTGLNVNIAAMSFSSPEVEMLGKILGTADLVGQMSDRAYLEKLLFLFREFKEGGIPGYENELVLLEKTLQFYDFTIQRFAGDLGNVNLFLRSHFRDRWNVDRELYEEAIQKQIKYLRKILTSHRNEYREKLQRKGLVRKLGERFPEAKR